MISRSSNKNYFEKVFQRPDPWGYALSHYEKIKYERQLGAIRDFSGQVESILEIGCAEGLYTAMMAEAFPGARIMGIDICSKAIERAKDYCKHCPNVEFMEADIIELFRHDKLPPRSFDVIIQSELLYYIFPRLFFGLKLWTYFKDTVNLLKDDGVIVASSGINIETRYLMGVYYLILKRLSRPVWEARYREWNELRHRNITYDVKVFKVKR